MSLRYKQKRRERYYLSKLQVIQDYAYATCHDDCGDDDEGIGYCYRCSNTGYINCYCGGDLCVCMNLGEKPCPECGGY